ncbi:MAG: hypothetical protein COA52_10715 [Hyphomicrobiales bacterium]|nr:MAG: hypothetical protein COA52_10715 [Hyphomicrobiales bacterium]
MGVFDCIFSGLSTLEEEPKILMIDATHLKAQRTASGLARKGIVPRLFIARQASEAPLRGDVQRAG